MICENFDLLSFCVPPIIRVILAFSDLSTYSEIVFLTVFPLPIISEVIREWKVCFGASLRHTKGFRAANKITSMEKVTLSTFFFGTLP